MPEDTKPDPAPDPGFIPFASLPRKKSDSFVSIYANDVQVGTTSSDINIRVAKSNFEDDPGQSHMLVKGEIVLPPLVAIQLFMLLGQKLGEFMNLKLAVDQAMENLPVEFKALYGK
jgi:hypothetical protein